MQGCVFVVFCICSCASGLRIKESGVASAISQLRNELLKFGVSQGTMDEAVVAFERMQKYAIHEFEPANRAALANAGKHLMPVAAAGPVDVVGQAWTSGDVDKMMNLLALWRDRGEKVLTKALMDVQLTNHPQGEFILQGYLNLEAANSTSPFVYVKLQVDWIKIGKWIGRDYFNMKMFRNRWIYPFSGTIMAGLKIADSAGDKKASFYLAAYGWIFKEHDHGAPYTGKLGGGFMSTWGTPAGGGIDAGWSLSGALGYDSAGKRGGPGLQLAFKHTHSWGFGTTAWMFYANVGYTDPPPDKFGAILCPFWGGKYDQMDYFGIEFDMGPSQGDKRSVQGGAPVGAGGAAGG